MKEIRSVITMIQTNQATINNYSRVYYLYKSGQISEELWYQFCLACLETLMKDNKEVLKSLKNI